MKKLIVVMTLAVLGVMACKKKEEPAPEMKKYVYTRTPGEVTQIVGDIFVDTGGTVFTVKGKGFDPKRKKFYHLLLGYGCVIDGNITSLNGCSLGNDYADTIKLESINDSVIRFKVDKRSVFTVRNGKNGIGCSIKDTVSLTFAVTSLDSTSNPRIYTNFSVLKEKKVKNKLFFNILSDTLFWHTKSTSLAKPITLDDVRAGGSSDYVQLFFNDTKLVTSSTSTYCFLEFSMNEPTVGDGYFQFDKYFYGSNSALGLTDGFYNITMKEKRTGLPIEEKHGKKGVYLKFVN